ncbi:hypothetical protein [Trichothermofontia sp.]
MITFVLGFNLVVSLISLFIAWKLWQVRLTLARAASVLSSVERQTHRVLSPAPHYIMIGERGTHSLRQRLQRLDGQLRQLRQLLGILRFCLTLWQRREPISRIALQRRRSRQNFRSRWPRSG